MRTNIFVLSETKRSELQTKKLNCFVCLDQLVDGIEGKYNYNARLIPRQIWPRKLTALETSP